MPEFPEVFTITKNLKDLLPGATLCEIEILDYHPKVSLLSEFEELKNTQIINVKNISKSIIFEFSNDKKIVSHLAMTGRFRYSENKETFGWDKVRFKFQKNHKIFFINFTDTRKFGKLLVTINIPKEISANPLEYSEKEIREIIRKILKSNKSIKELLLDQKIFSGLGNIYSNDTLFISKTHPLTKGKDLTEDEIRKLIRNGQSIIKEGIELGGSSLNDKMYTNIFGEEGKYQNNFKVYNLKKCKTCHQEIKKIMIAGRGTFYCENCLTN